MSKVFTANVYITKSREAIDKIFFGANQLTSLHERTSLLSEEELAQSFLYSPNKNDGLLRFEYSFGAAGKHWCKCQFVETSQLLELILVGNDPMARILADKLAQVDGEAEIRKAGSLDSEFISGETKLKADTITGKLKSLANSSKYYVAFGEGDDLSKWSGPHVMSLKQAVLSNDDANTRMVEVMFAPNPGSHKLWSKRFTKDFGYGGLANNFNQISSRKTYLRTYAKEYVAPDSPDFAKPILNVRIRDLIKKYIKATTSSRNVVVAFPNDLPNYAYDAAGHPLAVGLLKMGMRLSENVTEVNNPSKNILNSEVTGEKGVKTLVFDGYNIEMGIFYPIGDKVSDNAPPPILTPLYKFTSRLRDLDQTWSQDFTFFEETDVRILKLWEKYGLIETSDQPAFVFGDEAEIKKLLYLETAKEYNGNSTKNFLFGKPSSTIELPFMAPIESHLRYDEYVEEFADDLLTRGSKNSSFGENVGSLDKGLDYLIGGASEAKRLIGSNDIVLRHNISNPNVRELEYSTDAYMAALNGLDVYPELSKSLINATTFPIVKDLAFKVLGKDFIHKTISNIEDTLADSSDDLAFSLALTNNVTLANITKQAAATIGSSNISISEQDEIGRLDLMDLVAFISFIRHLDRRRSSDDGVQVVTDANRYESTYLAMYDRLKSLMVKVDVKTLPFFNRTLYFGKKVSLIGVTNSPMGMQSKRALAPYTGEYQIVGHSHVIEQSDIYSSFSLVRVGSESKKELTTATVKEAVVDYLTKEIADLKFGGTLEGKYGFGKAIEYYFLKSEAYLLGTDNDKAIARTEFRTTKLKELREMLQRIK